MNKLITYLVLSLVIMTVRAADAKAAAAKGTHVKADGKMEACP